MPLARIEPVIPENVLLHNYASDHASHRDRQEQNNFEVKVLLVLFL